MKYLDWEQMHLLLLGKKSFSWHFSSSVSCQSKQKVYFNYKSYITEKKNSIQQ